MATAWTEAQRRNSRREYERLYQTGHQQRASHVIVPADVTVMERDPSPCFMCGSAGGCRHRKWMLAE